MERVLSKKVERWRGGEVWNLFQAAKRARISQDLAAFADGLTSGDLATWAGNLRYATEARLCPV